MPVVMTPTRTLGLSGTAALIAAASLLSFSAAAAPATAQAATAAACGGVTLSPASRKVRRGGRVLLEGKACGASASSSGSDSVQVKIRKGKRWGIIGSAQADADGSFSVCAKVAVPRRAKVARLQATSSSGATGSATLRVSNRGASRCETPSSTSNTSDAGSEDSSSSGNYAPPGSEGGNPDCPLSQPGSSIGLTVPSSCSVVTSDTASNPDPNPFWGEIDCEYDSRHQQVTSGGDTHSTGTGTSQGNSAYRRLTVVDGDDVYGERCELGFNNWSGPTALYHEGQRRVTFITLRMPNSSNVNGQDWRTVMQMKQAQGYRNPDQSPIIEMQVRDGRWSVSNSWNGIWNAPAQQNTWTRFAFDITYSQDPSVGSIKVYVDLNGDGDASDSGEQSSTMHMATLRAETAGTGYSDYEVGESIPNHLRAGIYQNPNYSCPSGCSVDVDNVQVVKA
jgi:hypothetical protein